MSTASQGRILAGDPKHAEALAGMRKALSEWAMETGDAMPARPSPDEFDPESGDPLPNRVRPRPTKSVHRGG